MWIFFCFDAFDQSALNNFQWMALIYQNILCNLIGFCSFDMDLLRFNILMVRSGFELVFCVCAVVANNLSSFFFQIDFITPFAFIYRNIMVKKRIIYIYLYIRTNLVINAG